MSLRAPTGMAVAAALATCGSVAYVLVIATSGVVAVQAENSFSEAACFTSLDGVSFAP